jgi:hypothetical protein
MISFSQIFENFLGISVWELARWLVLFALFVYFLFAMIVVRQVYLMTEVVSGKIDWLIKIIAWLHLVLAIGIIFLAFNTL